MTEMPPAIRPRLDFRPLVLLSVMLGMGVAGARAIPSDLGNAVPADAVAVIFNRGSSPDTSVSNLRATFDLAANVLSRASGMGLLSQATPETRVWIEVLASLPVVTRHPHALVLLDVSAAPLPDGGHKLARLRAALVIDTGGLDQAIDERIQHFLSTFTNNEEATLSREETEDGTVFSLRDRRLDSWVVIQWGRLGSRYIITIGEGTMAGMLQTLRNRSLSLNKQEWYARAFSRLDGAEASAGCYVSLGALYRNGDHDFSGKIDDVRAALHLGTTERALWLMRERERAIEISGFLRKDGVDVRQPLATAGFPTGVSSNVVPEQATGYTVVAGDPRRLFHALCNAYLAARDRDHQAESLAFWRGVERQAGVDVDQDVFPFLSAPIVVHDYPKHLLRLPFTWTAITRVRGNADVLRDHIDKLLSATASTYFETVLPKLRRHSDGVWSIELGISGPALAVTDDWLILGYCPQAVRENINLLKSLHDEHADLVDRGVVDQTTP